MLLSGSGIKTNTFILILAQTLRVFSELFREKVLIKEEVKLVNIELMFEISIFIFHACKVVDSVNFEDKWLHVVGVDV